jgi:hypothetical protein
MGSAILFAMPTKPYCKTRTHGPGTLTSGYTKDAKAGPYGRGQGWFAKLAGPDGKTIAYVAGYSLADAESTVVKLACEVHGPQWA